MPKTILESHITNQTKLPRLIFFIFSFIILVTSGFFRIWHLSNIPGINCDEAYYGVNSLAYIHGELHGLHTPNGNMYNVFYFAPCILLHRVFAPSVILLRVIAVLCGLLALLTNYLMCRRVFDWRTALTSTLVLSVLPENIAQGRFGWDPAQSLLIDIIVLYLSILVVADPCHSVKWVKWTLFALIASISVHPTNVFTGIYLLFAIVWRWRSNLASTYSPQPFSVQKALLYLATSVAFLFMAWDGCLIFIAIKNTHFFGVGTLREYASLPLSYATFFNGIVIYNYISGSFMPFNTPGFVIMLWTVIPCLIFAATFIYGCIIIRRPNESDADRVLFIGWIAGVALFFIIAGPAIFIPGNERYALCLIMPGTLAICRAFLLFTRSRKKLRSIAPAAGISICLIMLTSFYICYFRYIETTGGDSFKYLKANGGSSALAFRTGPIEPKLAALNLIRKQINKNQRIIILTTGYSIYEPICYYAEAGNNHPIILLKALKDIPLFQSDFRNAVNSGGVWSVEFHDSPTSQATRTYLRVHQLGYNQQQILDYGRRPAIDIIHWLPNLK